MSYRRREITDVSLADPFWKTKRLAAVSSIRFVRRHVVHDSQCLNPCGEKPLARLES